MAERRDVGEAFEVALDVVGDEAEMRIADVVGLEVDASGRRLQILDQLEYDAAGELPERGVELGALVADDASDVLDVPGTTNQRLSFEQAAVEVDAIGRGSRP